MSIENEVLDADTEQSAARIMDACEQLDGLTRKVNRAHLDDMLIQIAHLMKTEPEKQAAYALDALNRVNLAELQRHISPFEARSYLVSFMPFVTAWERDNAQRCELMSVARI